MRSCIGQGIETEMEELGAWGLGLYDNDLTLDVKGDFERELQTGKPAEAITSELLENYRSIQGSPTEEPLFWCALADAQWGCGALMPEVKERALFWIEHGIGGLMVQGAAPFSGRQMAADLTALRTRLLSPMPAAKAAGRRNLFVCPWRQGDVFAHRLESDLAREKGLYGRYFLIRKVDTAQWYPGHQIPVVYVKITKDRELPTNLADYNRQEYVQTWFTKYEDRFLPIDMRCPQEDLARKARLSYEVDDYGFLPQYRVKLVITSKSSLNKGLEYLGNFAEAALPAKEFIPHIKENLLSVPWKQFGVTFEEKMIQQYCGHNLRELRIYKK